MLKSLISCFRNLRMRTQIMILEFSILLLVLGLAGCAIYVEVQIFYYISTTSSETMINITDIKQITQATQLVSHYINLKHQRNIHLVQHVAEFLFVFDQNKQNFLLTHPLDACLSLQQFLQYEQYLIQTPKFCYQLHGVLDHITLPKDNENVLLLYNAMNLIDQYNLVMNIQLPKLVQVIEISQYSLDIVSPIGYIINDYKLYQRPWYKNHITKITANPNELYSISDVYKVFVEGYDYQFSITHSLFNKNKEFIGVAKTLQTINDPNFDKILYNVILINYAGQVLYNGMEVQLNQSEIFYIFNESITGFNQTDWFTIEQHAMSMNNRQYPINYNQEILVLYNKHHQQYVHVQSQKFKKENFTLIIFTNVSSIKIMEKEFNNIGNQFYFWNFLMAAIVILVGILSFMISLLVITLIFNPVQKLTNQVSQHILQIGNNTNQYFFKKMLNVKIQQFDLLNKLNDKFINFQNLLLQSQTRKSEQCLNIESLQYNRKESNFDSSKILNQINLVPYYSNYEKNETSNIILASLLQKNEK